MKISVTCLFLFLMIGATVHAQEDRAAEFTEGPKIEFERTVHDFGENPQGTPVSTDFVFRNTGNAPLVLQNVKASCGCTTPFWPKEPIMPGQESKISAKYNMARAGNFTKTITVTVKPHTADENPDIVKLTIKGKAVAATPENSVEEVRPSIITTPGVDE